MIEYYNDMANVNQGTDQEKNWVKQFAAALLMPANIMRKFWAEGQSCHEIAQSFYVSETTLQNRLSALHLK